MCGYSHLVAYLFIDYFRLYVVYQLLMISIHKGLSERCSIATSQHPAATKQQQQHQPNVWTNQTQKEKQPANIIIDALLRTQENHIDELMAHNKKGITYEMREKKRQQTETEPKPNNIGSRITLSVQHGHSHRHSHCASMLSHITYFK